MKASLCTAFIVLVSVSSAQQAPGESPDRAALARAAQSNPNSVSAWTAYAEYLDRYGDPGARDAYSKLLTAQRNAGDTAKAAVTAHRLGLFDLLAGDRDAASRNLGKPVASGGLASQSWPTTTVPGPIRSFARMAALSPDAAPEDVLPALARNVVTNGYQASHNNEALEQTEYLKLVHRYLSQARELEKLAGDSRVITIENCESPKAGELLRIIGFRMRGGCGSEVVLETVNEPRAFVTTDSGFPVNELEAALRTNRPFTYDYHPTTVTVLFGAEYWMPGKEKDKEFIEAFISDPSMCRLYLGFTKL